MFLKNLVYELRWVLSAGLALAERVLERSEIFKNTVNPEAFALVLVHVFLLEEFSSAFTEEDGATVFILTRTCFLLLSFCVLSWRSASE